MQRRKLEFREYTSAALFFCASGIIDIAVWDQGVSGLASGFADFCFLCGMILTVASGISDLILLRKRND